MRAWTSWEQTEGSVAPSDATGGDPSAYAVRGDPLPAVGLALLALAALWGSYWVGVQHHHDTTGVLLLMGAVVAAVFFLNALTQARRPIIVIGPMGVYFAGTPGEGAAAVYQWRDVEALLRMRIMVGNHSRWRTRNAVGVQVRRPRGPTPVLPAFPPHLMPAGVEEKVRQRLELSARQPSRTVGKFSTNHAQLASALRRYAPFVPLVDAPMLDFRLSRREELALRRAQRNPMQARVGRIHRTSAR
jgi:hypothetical protein